MNFTEKLDPPVNYHYHKQLRATQKRQVDHEPFTIVYLCIGLPAPTFLQAISLLFVYPLKLIKTCIGLQNSHQFNLQKLFYLGT